MDEKIKKILKNQEWKKKDLKYLVELEKFLDLSDNIQDRFCRKCIINQMIRCDRSLTQAAEKMFFRLLKEK